MLKDKYLVKGSVTDKTIYSVKDNEFSIYGRLIRNYNPEDLIDLVNSKINLSKEIVYEPSVLKVYENHVSKSIEQDVFGEIEIQIGYCAGINNQMNAMEYHKSSEVIIAITDIILMLGKYSDIENNAYQSGKMQLFYMKKGDIVELYSGVLHYCPIQTDEYPFRAIIILPKGTNTEPASKKLYAKNKWLFAHKESAEYNNQGISGEIHGNNVKIQRRI